MATKSDVDVSGLREQILANVEVLYPALVKGTRLNDVPYIVRPKSHLITKGVHTTMHACILFSHSNPSMDELFHKFVLIRGPDAASFYESLERLHDLTRNMLNEMEEKYQYKLSSLNAISVAGNGSYYVKE